MSRAEMKTILEFEGEHYLMTPTSSKPLPPVREFPIALAMYVGDVHNAIHSAGISTLNLNAALLSRNLSAMQTAAELIATEANTANVLAEKIAKKVAELRRRNPQSGVR